MHAQTGGKQPWPTAVVAAAVAAECLVLYFVLPSHMRPIFVEIAFTGSAFVSALLAVVHLCRNWTPDCRVSLRGVFFGMLLIGTCNSAVLLTGHLLVVPLLAFLLSPIAIFIGGIVYLNTGKSRYYRFFVTGWVFAFVTSVALVAHSAEAIGFVGHVLRSLRP